MFRTGLQTPSRKQGGSSRDASSFYFVPPLPAGAVNVFVQRGGVTSPHFFGV
ncbi:Uncharacterized protein dnm_001180 [Desulfonema magnum]|uniref:Uncharacterized protein n=1 Tax=Desulfonema magnum TaxID=45655 RepID=A0A975BF36_9BACT|nr:Uncharacterized protein dnm_001180 [Desulfonema magnum]